MVVSNIDLTDKLKVMKPSEFLDTATKGFTININNDYRYLKTGYYVSLHAEILGNNVIPSSENIIDANRTPILLLRAARAGVATLPFVVTDSVKKIITDVGLPVVLFAVNPFIYDGFEVAHNKSGLYRAMKSLGMNYKFDVCAIPLKGQMNTIKSFFGKCQGNSELNDISEKVYKLFKIPICKLHIQIVDSKAYLSGLQPLKEEEITPTDLKMISNEIMLISQQGDHIGV